MLSSRLISRSRRLGFRVRRLVDTDLSGAYRSAFKGQGIEFESVRPYEPGDDIRALDWNVTARLGEPHVKQFREERELTIMLLVDVSASIGFGTAGVTKREVAAELAAGIAYSAIRNQDRVGLLLFGDRLHLYVPPRRGRNHVLRLIREILGAEANDCGTDLSLAFRALNRALPRRSALFVISDFLSPLESYARELTVIGRRHDTTALILSDPLENQWLVGGLFALRDSETGELIWADMLESKRRDIYSHRVQRFQNDRSEVLRRADVDFVNVSTNDDPLRQLAMLFTQRARRQRHR